MRKTLQEILEFEFMQLVKDHPDYGPIGVTLHFHNGQVVQVERSRRERFAMEPDCKLPELAQPRGNHHAK